MNLFLRFVGLGLVASAAFACSSNVVGGGGGSGAGGSTTGCPAPNPGMCSPTPCIDGAQRTGQASCENGAWVCLEATCGTGTGGGCSGSLSEVCSGGHISTFCCPAGAPCAASIFCDLGGGACIDGTTCDVDGGAPCTKPTIEAASFDQSCASDGDCVPVYQGTMCSDCRCGNAAVSQKGLAAYDAAVAAADPGATVCDCKVIPTPSCTSGVCTLP